MRFFLFINVTLLLFFSIISPLHINGSPGKSCTECRKDQVIAFFKFILKIPQAKRKRTGTCITITFYINHYLFAGNFQAVSYCINDAQVRLMRNNPVDIILSEIISFRNGNTSVRHIGYGILKYRTTFLIKKVHVIITVK